MKRGASITGRTGNRFYKWSLYEGGQCGPCCWGDHEEEMWGQDPIRGVLTHFTQQQCRNTAANVKQCEVVKGDVKGNFFRVGTVSKLLSFLADRLSSSMHFFDTDSQL